MSIGLGVTRVVTATAANINSAQNTALLTHVASKPVVIQRFGAVADAAAGIPAATRLKLRRVAVTTGAVTDITEAGTLNPGAALARGILVTKTAVGPTGKLEISAGDTIQLAVEVAAGAASTANVWLEMVELPFAGSLVPATAVVSA